MFKYGSSLVQIYFFKYFIYSCYKHNYFRNLIPLVINFIIITLFSSHFVYFVSKFLATTFMLFLLCFNLFWKPLHRKQNYFFNEWSSIRLISNIWKINISCLCAKPVVNSRSLLLPLRCECNCRISNS